MANIIKETTANHTRRITVQLTRDDYYPSFEQALKKYSKQANLPGFRKGMVPVGHIKKIAGPGLFTEEIVRKVEQELNQYLETEGDALLGQPLPDEANNDVAGKLDMNQPGDVAFSFEIGVRPVFQLPDFNQGNIRRPKITVTGEMIDEELKGLRKQLGERTEMESVESQDALVQFQFEESDAAGQIAENGISNRLYLEVSSFTDEYRQQLMGKAVSDSVMIQLGKAFSADNADAVVSKLELREVDGAGDKWFRITLLSIVLQKDSELTPEFFDKVFPGKAIATESEFRQALREDLEQYWASQARNQVHDEIYHYLLDNTAMELPEDFLKRWMQSGNENPKSPEEVEKQWPSFVNSLRWSMISNFIRKENNLDVTFDEIKEHARRQLAGYMGMNLGDGQHDFVDKYVQRMMQDRKYMEDVMHQIQSSKVLAWAEGQVTRFQEVEMTREAFLEQQHHHHH